MGRVGLAVRGGAPRGRTADVGEGHADRSFHPQDDDAKVLHNAAPLILPVIMEIVDGA